MACKFVSHYLWNEVEAESDITKTRKNRLGQEVISDQTLKQRMDHKGVSLTTTTHTHTICSVLFPRVIRG